MSCPVSRYYHSALIHLLKEEDPGGQSLFAETQGIDRGYLSAITREKGEIGTDTKQNCLIFRYGLRGNACSWATYHGRERITGVWW